MLTLLRPAAIGRQAVDLGRAEAAARIAMVWETEDMQALAPRPPRNPYGYCSAGLVVTGAVLGAMFLFGAPL